MELMNNQERIQLLERDLVRLQNELQNRLEHHSNELRQLKLQNNRANPEPDAACVNCRRNSEVEVGLATNSTRAASSIRLFQAQELERWKQECEMLRSRPEQNDERLTEYYETKIRDLLEEKQVIHSEASSLLAENKALAQRLERASLEKSEMKEDMERGIEEFRTSCDNYKSQLDAMTEHLATQNEKITRQCDEIQALKMRVASRK